jgi:hypothetical protein
VAGVSASGIDAAKAVLNCRSDEILTGKGPGPRFFPSEDITQWPEDLRKKIERGDIAREEEEREI